MEKEINFEDDEAIFKVVINHDEMYSIWPADRENPLGWRDTGFSGNRLACMQHMKEIWTDMRPLSLRKAMEQATKRE